MEKLRGEGWDIDGTRNDVDIDMDVVEQGRVGRDGGEDDWRERREKDVLSVEKDDDCVLRLGTRRSDLRGVC